LTKISGINPLRITLPGYALFANLIDNFWEYALIAQIINNKKE